MKLCRVGNQTNSPDPVAVNSRVFVGNLNTFQCSKAELERMFQRYGRIAGISMHKGYAFVQFANAFDARSACLGEDKRVVLGQTLDVNLVSEPKAHQTGRKRQNITKTGNDWDYYYDSYYATVGLPAGPPSRMAPPHKRPRLMVPLARPGPPPPGPQGPSPGLKLSGPLAPPPMNGHLLNGQPPIGVVHGPGPASPPLNGHLPTLNNGNTINVFSNPDILICGNCREMYTDLQELLSHKKAHCKLRFACKCHTLPEGKTNSEATLLCSSCRASFSSAWDLMVHVQAAHMLNIYQLGVPDEQPPASLTVDRQQSQEYLQQPQQQQPQSQPQQQPQSQPQQMLGQQKQPQDLALQQVAIQQQIQQVPVQQQQPQPQQMSLQPQLQQQIQLQPQVSERLQGSDALSETEDSAIAQVADVAVTSPAASPAASSSSDHDVVLGATLQCNLTAEPLKDEDDALSPVEPQSSTEVFTDAPSPGRGHAWGSAEQQV